MACSKEEIERKRLAALQKRQNKITVETNAASKAIFPASSRAGPMKTFINNPPKSYHPYASSSNSYKEKNNSIVPVDKVISGTVYLISENRFEVKPSEFCAPLINIFKTIPSKIYDANSKLWNFSIDDYETLMSKVAPLAPHVVLGPIPPYVLKILREKLVDPNDVDLTPIEKTLREKLLPFQEEGVRFAIARGGRCMIADDMGLGKTFQALAVASYYRSDWPLLIVTTSSMREVWQTKIHELLPSVPLMNIVTLSNSKDAQLVADKQTQIVIASFKITTMHSELLKNKNFGCIIIDESHKLKSARARCTAALARAGGCARRVLLLSGTPALSRPAELHAQLRLARARLLPSYTEFGKRYCNGKQTAFGWDMSGQSNLAELQIILQRMFLIRRTKEQVLTLGAKTRESVLLDESLVQDSRQQLSEIAERYKRTAAAEKHSALLTYFSETARIKIPAVCKYISQVLAEESEKCLVFAHHRCVIDAVCSLMDERSVPYICIVGATPTAVRAELVEKFQHGNVRAAVLSVTAAGSGLTLTAASLVIFAELHWNPGTLTQAEARAHRLGRAGGVRVRYLLAPRSADAALWPLLQRKLHVLNDVGLSKDSFEVTTMRQQDSKNNISQYLTPPKVLKNKNDYIPGTNIKKDAQKSASFSPNSSTNGYHSQTIENTSENTNENTIKYNSDNITSASYNDSENNPNNSDFEMLDFVESEFLEKSFLSNDEDDELLANIDMC